MNTPVRVGAFAATLGGVCPHTFNTRYLVVRYSTKGYLCPGSQSEHPLEGIDLSETLKHFF